MSRLLLLLLSLPLCLQAAPRKGLFRPARLHLNLMNAGIGTPPRFINGRMHPGLEVGVSKPFARSEKKNRPEVRLLLGYMAQPSLQRAAYLQPGLGYRFRLYRRLDLIPHLDVALMGVRQTNDGFRYQGNGQYRAEGRWGLQVLPALGLELSLRTGKKPESPAICGGYRFGMQLPFSTISSLLPINRLHLGVQFPLSLIHAAR